MKTFTEIGALFRQLGPVRFFLLFATILVPILAYGLIFARLAGNIGWPEDYGFTCRRKCMFVHMWHSHKLVTGGTSAELALFAFIWFIPAMVVAVSIAFIVKRWLKQRRARIRPMDAD